MRHLSRFLVAAALLASTAGCSTLNQIHAQDEGAAAMGGIRHLAKRWSHPGTTPGDQAAMVFDAPFSIALDLVLLPFSGINEIVEGGITVTDAAPAVEREVIYSSRTHSR